MVTLTNPDTINKIMDHIEANVERISVDQKVFSIMEDNIRDHVIEKLKNELISKRAFKVSCERIPPINIFKLVNKRLSKIYSDSPLRKAIPEADQDLVHLYERKAHLNRVMSRNNLMTNAQRRTALEPYLDKGKPRIRVIPSNYFLVYSEDDINRLNVDVFIKFAGTIKKTIQEKSKVIEKEVSIYHLFTEDEFTIIDSEREYRLDLLVDNKGKQLKNNKGVVNHNTGRLPITYVNDSIYELMPTPNTDDIHFALNILTLLTDLAYAVKYQAHSIIYTINVDSEKIDMNPDAFLDLKGDGAEGEQSKIGVIKPEVDIVGTLKLIASTLKLYLESKGLRVDVNSSISSDKAESGIHETIKNATLIEERKDQIDFYKEVEMDLWELISIRHNQWRNTNQLKGDFSKKVFSDNFEVVVHFGEQKPVVSRRDKGLMLQTELDAGLISQEEAIRELKPHLSASEIKEEIKKIEEDKKKNIGIESQIKMNPNNKKLAEDKRNKDGSNANSTAQDENPNRR